MSKPQVAAEPSMEEILSSIRKMISDDKPGPSPMPDQMSRTPFGEATRAPKAAEFNGRSNGDASGAPRTNGVAPGPNFNSLADALKVATALSDQRRALPQDVAGAPEKGPRSNLDALTELSAARGEAVRGPVEVATKAALEVNGLHGPLNGASLSNSFERGLDAATSGASEGIRELLSFDFGAVVPQRESAEKPLAVDTKSPIVVPESVSAAETEADAKPQDDKSKSSTQPRVLHLRNGLNGNISNGAALNIAPFPRVVPEVAKTAVSEPVVPLEKPAEKDRTSDKETAAQKAVEPIVQDIAPPKPDVVSDERKPMAFQLDSRAEAAEPAPATDLLGEHGEALLDAVVDLVQKQPSSLSVFASGASFISGVSGKKPEAQSNSSAGTGTAVAAIVEAAAVAESASAAAGVPAPKIDRAAAELLRPMLRQWLAENMGRILEEALRSEMSDQSQGDKGPGKN